MKCGRELLEIAEMSKNLQIIHEIEEIGKAIKEAKAREKRTIEWCETVLSNYLEKYALNYPDFILKGYWTYESKSGTPIHFGYNYNREDVLFPLHEDSFTYVNGEKSYKRDDEKSIDFRVVKSYCKEHCIEVKREGNCYKTYGTGKHLGSNLCFRIAPECSKR